MEERSNNNVAVDVSRFFLFESTGDSSEIVNSSPAAEDYWGNDDDDDAQSCSYDDTSSSDVQTIRVFGDGNEDNSEPGRLDCSKSSEYEDEDEDEDEDGDEVNQSQNKQKESSKQQVGSVELVSEKDGDRLFWEACLAS